MLLKNIRPLLCKKRNGFKAGFVFDGAAPKKGGAEARTAIVNHIAE